MLSPDDFETGPVKDIESEKNYEEIWQHYTYYEVVYDADERVTSFKEYKPIEPPVRSQIPIWIAALREKLDSGVLGRVFSVTVALTISGLLLGPAVLLYRRHQAETRDHS